MSNSVSKISDNWLHEFIELLQQSDNATLLHRLSALLKCDGLFFMRIKPDGHITFCEYQQQDLTVPPTNELSRMAAASRYFTQLINQDRLQLLRIDERWPEANSQEARLLQSASIERLTLLPRQRLAMHDYLLGIANGDRQWQCPAELLQLLSLAVQQLGLRFESEFLLNELQANHQSSTEILYRLPMAAVLIDKHNQISVFNHAAQHGFLVSEQQAVQELVREAERGILLDTIQLVRDRILGQAWCELPTVAGADKYNWFKLNFSRMPSNDGMLLMIAEQCSSNEVDGHGQQLQANFDALTGLPNRTYFESIFSSGQQSQANELNFIGFINLDQFQIVNNISGHKAGDQLLIEVAQRLKKLVRKGDVVARLGSDEYGILMHGISQNTAEQVAGRICQALAGHEFIWQGRTHAVTVSMGLAAINPDDDITQVLGRADAACRVVKEGGRNGWHFYRLGDPLMDRIHTDMSASVDIVGALALNHFTLFYQPIEPVNTSDAGLHVEILLRMINEDGELVAPGIFLPAAERFNLAAKVDRWVIEHVLRWGNAHLETWQSMSMVAINLSALSLDDDEFMEWLEMRLLSEPELVAKLCFEITETAAVSQLDNATRLIDIIHPMGCSLALDDFGSGFSSFAYLKLLDVDFVKIDGQFISQICSTPADQAIVKAICELAKDMHFQTVAEFVESEDIGKLVHSFGVDFAQGYGIAKPQPLTQLTCADNLQWAATLSPSA
ncbi:putative bifunctional diguanylate cyclase/phosphodiesterase [Shewanella waksmanii]|uniref:putative bifunctional diguanylate cyclase/phosphodiesterase n=1 Tax=Shewanella waksmanii TaxID=213783 RepID=UPI0004BB759C|nr:EAL domain-containing protein [Shewanella waksmanii]